MLWRVFSDLVAAIRDALDIQLLQQRLDNFAARQPSTSPSSSALPASSSPPSTAGASTGPSIAAILMEYFSYIVTKILDLEAPVRNAETRLWAENMQTKIIALADDTTGSTALIPVAFEFIFDKLGELKLDIANYKLKQLQPYLQQHGVKYEREKFDEKVLCGEVTLDRTIAWFAKVWTEVNGTSSSPPDASPSSSPSSASSSAPSSASSPSASWVLTQSQVPTPAASPISSCSTGGASMHEHGRQQQQTAATTTSITSVENVHVIAFFQLLQLPRAVDTTTCPETLLLDCSRWVELPHLLCTPYAPPPSLLVLCVCLFLYCLFFLLFFTLISPVWIF